ncbi:hypothetical protein [Chromobacterium sp. ASV23]|nr:hypothetical protein [Chromobacterium sp. ASV23]
MNHSAFDIEELELQDEAPLPQALTDPFNNDDDPMSAFSLGLLSDIYLTE